MVARFLLLASFILLFASLNPAQTTRPVVRPPETKQADDEQDATRLPEDMRIKMAIARAEEDHKKILQDVEKLSDLSSEIATDFTEHKKLSSDDMKKLGTIEKLAKRILTHAGGDETNPQSDSTEPVGIDQAIGKLNTTAASIRKEMTAETRFVVSATVIANSNEVISLSRLIRRFKKTD